MSTKLITARKGDKFRAEHVDQSDIGKQIRVLTKSGAIITDVLIGIHAGTEYNSQSTAIHLVFANVSPGAYGDTMQRGFDIDGGMMVTVTALAKPSGSA